MGIISGLFLFFGWIFNVKGLIIAALCLSSLLVLMLMLVLILTIVRNPKSESFINTAVGNIVFQCIVLALSIVLL